MTIEFVDIPGFTGRYQVNRQGDILTLPRRGVKRHLLQIFTGKGYKRVFLYTGKKVSGYPVHRLVALTFIPNPENKKFVNHKNGNKSDNKVDNLEWCTLSETQKHSREVSGNTGLGVRNSNYGYRKSKIYPQEKLRSRLIELGIPRNRHDVVSLGESLPEYVGDWFLEMYKDSSNPEGKEWCLVRYVEHDGIGGEDIKTGFNEPNEPDARAKMLIYLLENNLLGGSHV